MELTNEELHDWLEAALEIGLARCDKHKKTKLRLKYMIDEHGNLFQWYVYCPYCYVEYSVAIAFIKKEDTVAA